MIRRWSVVLAFAFALIGCAGAGSTGTGYSCPALSVSVSGSLVSPANGATGVSPSGGTLSFTISNSSISFDGAVVSLRSDPNAIPIFTSRAVLSAGVYVVTLPTLQAHTTYTVAAGTSTFSNSPCPGGAGAMLGSFTTQ